MILPIRTLGDPVLREPTKPVEHFDRRLRQLVKDMGETMYAAPGVGLAGPQVGMSIRLFVFDDGQTGPLCVVNPELDDGDGEVLEEEGCLSIPGPYYPTRGSIGSASAVRTPRASRSSWSARGCWRGSSSTRPTI